MFQKNDRDIIYNAATERFNFSRNLNSEKLFFDYIYYFFIIVFQLEVQFRIEICNMHRIIYIQLKSILVSSSRRIRCCDDSH